GAGGLPDPVRHQGSGFGDRLLDDDDGGRVRSSGNGERDRRKSFRSLRRHRRDRPAQLAGGGGDGGAAARQIDPFERKKAEDGTPGEPIGTGLPAGLVLGAGSPENGPVALHGDTVGQPAPHPGGGNQLFAGG